MTFPNSSVFQWPFSTYFPFKKIVWIFFEIHLNFFIQIFDTTYTLKKSNISTATSNYISSSSSNISSTKPHPIISKISHDNETSESEYSQNRAAIFHSFRFRLSFPPLFRPSSRNSNVVETELFWRPIGRLALCSCKGVIVVKLKRDVDGWLFLKIECWLHAVIGKTDVIKLWEYGVIFF